MPEDNFESLSNAEIRSKCIEYGLPNVPVTDSSRKVLIKKLRAVISGGGAVSSGTPTKKTARRETIHVSKTYSSTTEDAPAVANKVQSDNATQRSISRGINRRTIAATPSFDNEITTTTTKEQPVAKPAEVTAAPVSVRRRSVREQVVEKIVKSGERRSTIIIESDDEDELVLAAVEAEQMNKPLRQASRPPSRSERAGSLSKTGVVTTSYAKDLYAAPIMEEQAIVTENIVLEAARSDKGNIMDTYGILQSNMRKRTSEAVGLTTRPSYTKPAHSAADLPRYVMQTQSIPSSSSSNYYSPNLRRSVPAVGLTTTTSSPYSKPYYNEQSDDTDANVAEAFDTPYLSNFARNLERVKTEPLAGRRYGFFGGGGSSNSGVADDITRRYKRHTMYEAQPRRYNPANQSSILTSLLELWLELDEKYQLKRYFIILLLILLVILLYVLFSP